MWNLIKTEIKYNALLLIPAAALPFVFFIFAENEIIVFQGQPFLDKYFWSMLIGLGTYALIFALWAQRKKEARERLHQLLPLKTRTVGLQRWIFGVSPFLFVFAVLMLFNFIIPISQKIFVDRAIAQLGLLFIFIASFDLVINVDNYMNAKFAKKRSLVLAIVITTLVFVSIIVIAEITTLLCLEDFNRESLLIFWGVLISLISFIIFNNRKSYLD